MGAGGYAQGQRRGRVSGVQREMSTTGRAWEVPVAVVGGGILGIYLGILGPISVAVIRNENPLHEGWYLEAVLMLRIVLPALLAPTLGLLAWVGRAPRFRKAANWSALLALLSVALPLIRELLRGGLRSSWP